MITKKPSILDEVPKAAPKRPGVAAPKRARVYTPRQLQVKMRPYRVQQVTQRCFRGRAPLVLKKNVKHLKVTLRDETIPYPFLSNLEQMQILMSMMEDQRRIDQERSRPAEGKRSTTRLIEEEPSSNPLKDRCELVPTSRKHSDAAPVEEDALEEEEEAEELVEEVSHEEEGFFLEDVEEDAETQKKKTGNRTGLFAVAFGGIIALGVNILRKK